MLNKLFLFFTLLNYCSHAQLRFTEQNTNLGVINEAYEIKGDVIIKNNSEKKIFLMRAEADKGVKIFTSKKTLLPNDTALLIISFIPESAGKFKKKIFLVSSDLEKPYQLELTGNLSLLKTNDKLACFYFGSRKNTNVKIKDDPIVVIDPKEPRDNSNKIPDKSSSTVTYSPMITFPEVPEDTMGLSIIRYKPNNILFLVDVSNSMKDSLKLPLMKKALYVLIDAMRDIDKITFVTYSDSTKVIKEAISGADKKQLKEIVSLLKAKGLTKGNKAILKSQTVLQRHFIDEGNNQIIMATDGKFKFYEEDFKTWQQNQTTKKIILTTVAFGDDNEAMKNLREIAQKCEGSFIRIKKKKGSEEALLNEVQLRSRRK